MPVYYDNTREYSNSPRLLIHDMSVTTESATVSVRGLRTPQTNGARIEGRPPDRVPPRRGRAGMIAGRLKRIRVGRPGDPAGGRMAQTSGERVGRPRGIAGHPVGMTEREPTVRRRIGLDACRAGRQHTV